jgi:hypothetical protein
MGTNTSEPEASDSAATMTDLQAAVRLVARGLAASVTIVGVADPEAAAAAVGAAPAGVAIEVVTPVEPARPASTIRVRRTVAAHTRVERRPRVFVRRRAAAT